MQVSRRERDDSHNPVTESANLTVRAMTVILATEKGKFGLVLPQTVQTQRCRAEHHNTLPAVPRAGSWFPALTAAQLCLHLFGQQAIRKESFFLAELLSVNCTGSFPITL